MRIFIVSIILLCGFGAAHAMENEKEKAAVPSVKDTDMDLNKTDVVIHINDLGTNLGVDELIQEDDDSSSLAKKLQERYKINERYVPGLKNELERYPNMLPIIKKTVGIENQKKSSGRLRGKSDSNKSVPLEVMQLVLSVMQKKGDDDQKENTRAHETIKSKEKSLSTKNKLLGISGGGNIVGSLAFVVMLCLEIYKLATNNKCS